MLRFVFAAIVALTCILPTTTVTVSAASGDRTLYLYHTHTQKTGKFTFKRNGQFDSKVLKELNIFLADWRTNEPTKMDPALFDLLWAVYQEVGASQPISIVSSYRSPKTNAKLRKASSGVAENSQHMSGKAMDFFIPGIKLTKLREVAMRHQVGGVGYYPTSGSPFVHLDTGSVRAWPRMTRAQLKKVFPDGNTLHLPTDGTPLSSKGRAYAQAQWQKCRTVPCNGAIMQAGPSIMTADVTGTNIAPVPAQRPARLYGGQDSAGIMMASLEEPTSRLVTTVQIAPMPLTRPAGLGNPMITTATLDAGLFAPIPATKSPRMMLATREALPSDTGTMALAALGAIDDSAPQPRVLMTPKDNMVTAYVPQTEQDAGAQLALRMIIERETTGSLTAALKTPAPGIDSEMLTASLGGDAALVELKGMFDMTFNALSAPAPALASAAVRDAVESRQPIESIKLRQVELIAPEIDHVNETLVHPVLMSDAHFAELYETEGYLDKETELGPMTGRMGFLPDLGQVIDYDHFVDNAPLLVAAR